MSHRPKALWDRFLPRPRGSGKPLTMGERVGLLAVGAFTPGISDLALAPILFSNPRRPRPRFDPCFERDKIREFERLIPRAYKVMARRTGFPGPWPRRIECMDAGEIAEGRKSGAGHGLYLGGPK